MCISERQLVPLTRHFWDRTIKRTIFGRSSNRRMSSSAEVQSASTTNTELEPESFWEMSDKDFFYLAVHCCGLDLGRLH